MLPGGYVCPCGCANSLHAVVVIDDVELVTSVHIHRHDDDSWCLGDVALLVVVVVIVPLHWIAFGGSICNRMAWHRVEMK